MIVPAIKNDQILGKIQAPPIVQPFIVGQVDADKFVHILDDATLSTLMTALDTAQDFVDYLGAKEAFLKKGHLVVAAGEEELLAYYMKHAWGAETRRFPKPAGNMKISLDLGGWDSFQVHPQRVAQIEANKPSYLWDELVQTFSFHVLNDSQYFAAVEGVAGIEPALRFLASEPRVSRRALSDAIVGLVERAKSSQRPFDVRIVAPLENGKPYYLFLALSRRDGLSYEKYRIWRRELLQQYMFVLKVVATEALDIVGIAFGVDGDTGGTSEDLVYMDTRGWTNEDQIKAEALQKETGFLGSLHKTEQKVDVYPDVPSVEKFSSFGKGKNRNKLCPCGSGIKYKRCHGS